MRSRITRHRRPAGESAAEAPASIMIIDDDPNITSAAATVLASAGYRTICCHTGDEAIQCVRHSTPDMVIADMNLAGHSGLELCQQMQTETGMSDVPWMFLSGAQTPDIIRRSHTAGGAYYLRKPFDPQVLRDLVEKVMWLPISAAEYASAQA